MLGATMVLIYMRDKTMTKQTCDVESHGGMFRVVPEYWRTKQVHERKPVLSDTTDGNGKRDARPAIVTPLTLILCFPSVNSRFWSVLQLLA